MKTFNVTIIYTRASQPNVEHEALVEVQAESAMKARSVALRWFNDDARRRGSTPIRTKINSAVPSPEPEITSTVVEIEPEPTVEVGKRYTLRNFHHHVIVRAAFENANGRPLVVIESLSHGRLATLGEREFLDLCKPKHRTEFWSIYPQREGDDAPRIFKQSRPITNSSYDLDDLVQLKVTFRGDKIIAKEIIEP